MYVTRASKKNNLDGGKKRFDRTEGKSSHAGKMYSFEGDYRRKPQQNLSGASRRDEKAALLQHAQLERTKREQQRRRHDAAVKIQAHARSYVQRKIARARCRKDFDEALNSLRSPILALDELEPFFRRLLFFYERRYDSDRLTWLLQHALKYQRDFKVRSRLSAVWLWRLRWILRVSMRYTVEAINADKSHQVAIPLRVIEVLTGFKETEVALGDKAMDYLKDVFADLVINGYFDQVKKLLDDKVPPLLEASTAPPTPMSKCLFDMIERPLTIVKFMENTNDDFANLVLRQFSVSILSPRMTEPIKMYVIPALAKSRDFPYARLIACINNSNIEPTPNLLYSVLSLEPEDFCPAKSDEVLSNYLQVLASLSAIIRPWGPKNDEEETLPRDSDERDTSDDDSEAPTRDQQTSAISKRCIDLVNSERRVHSILASIDAPSSQNLLQPLCHLCHNLLMTSKLAVHEYKLLYTLAFKPPFLRSLWSSLLTTSQRSLFSGSASTSLLQMISIGAPLTEADSRTVVSQLAVFSSLFSLLIATLHDSEFFLDRRRDHLIIPPASSAIQPEDTENDDQLAMPFTTDDLVPLSGHLKAVCLGLVERAFPDTRPVVPDDYRSAVPRHSKIPSPTNTRIWTHLFKVTVSLLRQLHTRDLRRQFCPESHWIALDLGITIDKPQDFTFRRRRLRRGYPPFQGHRLSRVLGDEPEENGGPGLPPLTTKEIRTLTLLREIPFVVAFNYRVLVLQSLLQRDKIVQQGELVVHFMQGPSIQIAVRRGYLYEDAFEKLSSENEPELRLKMRVRLVNVAGLEEAGVDGGGLLREFLTELLKTSFDPNRGFFRLTKDNMLYPNPTAHLLVEDFPKHYYFIGRILGKALYENLLVELPFAEFFLSKIVGRREDVDVHHLASLDPVMYRNLLYLKSYRGDVTDLGLDFTVLTDELGERRIDELKPSGANIPVNNHNRIEYIHLMADYKLNRQIRAQCYAFKQGIGNVVPLEWLQMFNNKELQVLISGAQIPVDVGDLKVHTDYAGGYAPEHPTIVNFWKIVYEFNDAQKGQLLKFVTSCSRPPLLGFKELDPPFCIQHAGTIDRLPTSSTCMNLLKLPEFPDEATLREKLLYAIQAGAGFELS